jgi:SAM-dependent methyltransferase
LTSRLTPRRAAPPLDDSSRIADAYNEAGDEYLSYADGDPAQPFAFDGSHAYADRKLWAILDEKLINLYTAGERSIRILDAGCGPGTWLRRLVARACELGFVSIRARGFDIAYTQVHRARLLARELSDLPGVNLTFDVADITEEVPEADASVDLIVCLYGVLSHLPIKTLPSILGEFARVTAGSFITTVRPIGSTPTIFVAPLEKAREFQHDEREDTFQLELYNGRHLELKVHLFTAVELQSYVAEHFHVEKLLGLDLFHSRFAPDPRWNPRSMITDRRFTDELMRLEEAYAADIRLMERATHLMLVARAKGNGG